jgi:hypothetical protein
MTRFTTATTTQFVLVLALPLAFGCSKENKEPAPTPSVATQSIIDAAAAPTIADAAPAADAIHTVSLVREEPALVPGTPLSVFISQSSHKIRAPLAMVSILVSIGDQKAEIGWRIESNQIDGVWRPLEGRRFDNDTSEYVEEEIPGWLVRLDSVDETSANASPRAITVSFKRAP